MNTTYFNTNYSNHKTNKPFNKHLLTHITYMSFTNYTKNINDSESRKTKDIITQPGNVITLCLEIL